MRALPGSLVAGLLTLACAEGSTPRGSGPSTPLSSTPAASSAPPLLEPEQLPNITPSFSRGINLGNRLDAPSEGDWAPKLKASDFVTVAARGFDHVRLPVKFSAHALEASPFTLDASFLLRVDWAVEQALTNGLSIVVDLHHYEEIMEEPETHRERFLALWSQLAEHYRDYPAAVAFELMNEPNGAVDAAFYNPLIAETVALVRETNPTRTIVVDGLNFATASNLWELELPEDANLLIAAHTYEPSLFTFQAQDWMGPEWATQGVIFPGPPETPLAVAESAQDTSWVVSWFDAYNSEPRESNPCGPTTIEAQFAEIDQVMQRTGYRVYVNEWGAQDGGDTASRVNWMRAIREATELRGLGWAVWEDSGAMRLFNVSSGKWDEALVAALFDEE